MIMCLSCVMNVEAQAKIGSVNYLLNSCQSVVDIVILFMLLVSDAYFCK